MRPAHARSEEMTMQQLMGMMQGLQEPMVIESGARAHAGGSHSISGEKR